MDKVARAVGIDPIELRILNAYRDGDMKAHRRAAKNCALIESCQVVAQKSGWGLSADATRASSKVGGGEGARGLIPETVTDDEGKIGDRKRAWLAPDPFSAQGARGRLSAGHSSNNSSALGNAPQREDMEAEAERLGFKVATGAPAETPPSVVETRAAPTPAPPVQATPIGSGPSLPSAYTDRPAAGLSQPIQRPAPPAVPTPAVPPVAQPASPAPTDEAPKPHFQRGVKKPGVSRFISGSRRR